MLVNAPLIAKLFARPRLWANRRIASGRYGPTSRHAGKTGDIGHTCRNRRSDKLAP
jgi:hypothetical protein